MAAGSLLPLLLSTTRPTLTIHRVIRSTFVTDVDESLTKMANLCRTVSQKAYHPLLCCKVFRVYTKACWPRWGELSVEMWGFPPPVLEIIQLACFSDFSFSARGLNYDWVAIWAQHGLPRCVTSVVSWRRSLAETEYESRKRASHLAWLYLTHCYDKLDVFNDELGYCSD